MRKVELKEYEKYPFISHTDKYGNAEFSVCTRYTHGKLREIWLTSLQQEDFVEYHYKFDYSPTDFSINSRTYKGINEPRIWIHGWCKEHKGQFMRLYVPRNSDCFTVQLLSNFSINFDIT